MKKIFLLFAFAGIVGANSAASLVTMNKATTVTVKQDEKKKGCCRKHKDMNDSTKNCSRHNKGKRGCCKHGATPAVTPAK